MYKLTIIISLSIFLNSVLFAQLDFSKNNSYPNSQLAKMDSVVSSGKFERITSILIARNGKVLFEKYYNGADKNSLHNTRSATKTIATFLTGIAIDKGYINSEKDKIFSYLGHKLPVQNPNKRKEKITIEDLLTMSSMLECNDNNRFSRGNEERMYIIEDWTSFFIDLPIRSYPFGPKPKELPYGRAFSYCSAGAATMAEIIQSAVGIGIDQFAKLHLFEPLGIEKYKLDYNPEGILNTAGGSQYSSKDFLKLIQMCLNDGKWNGQQIISKTWLLKATTPKARVNDDLDYGYFFWLKSFGKEKKFKSFYMAGNGGQKILAMPELNLTVVITTTNYGNRNAHNYTDEILNEYIVPAIVNK